jgi:hypothetical protein
MGTGFPDFGNPLMIQGLDTPLQGPSLFPPSSQRWEGGDFGTLGAGQGQAFDATRPSFSFPLKAIFANLQKLLAGLLSDIIISVSQKGALMPSDPELQLRGRLVRSLGLLREMLPGSFVQRPCGNPNYHCADGKRPHPQYQLSVLTEGKLKTYHVPASRAQEVQRRVDLHRRFQKAAARITALNLCRWLRAMKPTEQKP